METRSLTGVLLFIKYSTAQLRFQRSAAITNLSEQTSNILGDLINAINPIYLVILGIIILAGCGFEMVHGSRKATSTRNTHVASKHAPYAHH